MPGRAALRHPASPDQTRRPNVRRPARSRRAAVAAFQVRKKLVLVAEPGKHAVIGLPSQVVDHRDNAFGTALVRHPLVEGRIVVHRHDGTSATFGQP